MPSMARPERAEVVGFEKFPATVEVGTPPAAAAAAAAAAPAAPAVAPRPVTCAVSLPPLRSVFGRVAVLECTLPFVLGWSAALFVSSSVSRGCTEGSRVRGSGTGSVRGEMAGRGGELRV